MEISMFGNTIALTAYADPVATVNRIGDAGNQGSQYFLRTDDSEIRFTIRHTTRTETKGPRLGVIVNRHNVEIRETVYGAAGVPDQVRLSYLVFENDRNSTAADTIVNVGAIVDFLTEANVTKLIGGES
jgi:hypothetical protein